MTKMNPEAKAKWVAALRSGEYKQIKNELANESGFCCLGVLCEVALKDGVPLRATNNPVYRQGQLAGHWNKSYDSEFGELPSSVVIWSGVGGNNPVIGEFMASEWNDEEGYNFNQIADLIEEHL